MITSALLGLLGGLLVGRRFRAFALIPILFAAVALGAILPTVGLLPLASALLGCLSFAICLQVGYAIMVAWGALARKPIPTRPLAT